MIVNVKIVDKQYQTRIGKTAIQFTTPDTGKNTNILVGANGCGKTSLLTAIMSEHNDGDGRICKLIRDNTIPVMYYSGEQATQKIVKGDEVKEDLLSVSQSHGQSLKAHLEKIRQMDGEFVFIMDEPDTALDYFAVTELCKVISEKPQAQFIIASHHPLLLTMKDANKINLDREREDYAGDVMSALQRRVNVWSKRNQPVKKSPIKRRKRSEALD